MNKSIIEARLAEYSILTREDEENAIKEIMQEIALYALATTDFFSHAQFQGGTALRILYNLPRFSEDLDFILNTSDPNFEWSPYIRAIQSTYELYGITPEINDRSKASSTIQKLFLKSNSIGKEINLHFSHHPYKKITIKLEIDTNPPKGSQKEQQYLDFPIDYAITSQTLSSNFSGKCHALLCRPYEKGRDWFDFSWYISKKQPINLTLLQNALNQYGPWRNSGLVISEKWLKQSLEEKIKTINWNSIKSDVIRFLKPEQQKSLELWSEEFFLSKLDKLKGQIEAIR